ncbi:MAG TPA: PEP/pyruvate-binding domain-containing protein, partial [Terriglobales bacterium]|nr:PEP/pyruvate-binding domain-containing protein [Terriglobales bacterium]
MTILSFSSPEATLEKAGGKGANLALLAQAGFPVPPGFIISTAAYREFVSANRWLTTVQSVVENLSAEDSGALEKASAQIRAAFEVGKMPEGIESAIQEAYADFENKPVAVRSSATAEDLPDLSFAGQQDTSLNVIGADRLLQAVVNCWSSLWTGRAIGYRIRNGIDHNQAAVAVIVQEMVQSESSGVLFTANPLSGLRSEAVIDATFGLGEALVSGQVEPDHYVVDTLQDKVTNKKLGAKKLSTRGKSGGGVEVIEENADSRQALSDEDILKLASMGAQIQNKYGFPQDIEWALGNGELYILQSRAITSLFPVPEVSFDPLIVWFSFGAAQGLVGPMTPIGIDTAMHIVAGAGRMFGVQLKPYQSKVFAAAGERIWIKISDLIRHPIGNRIIGGVTGFIEPGTGKILKSLMADPRLGAGRGKLKLSTLRRLVSFALPMLGRFARNMLRPEKARAEFDASIESYLARAEIAPASDRFERLANVVTFMRERIGNVFEFLLPRFIPIFGPSLVALNLLNEVAGGDRGLVLEITRGLPDNVTTEMDLALWKTAQEIRLDSDSAAVFDASHAPTLARRYLSETLPSAGQSAIAHFMDKYGMRGVGEIDFGRPRWREDPTPIMHTLQSYLRIDPTAAPDMLFAKGQEAAREAINGLAAKARRQPAGTIKEKVVRAMARRIRLLMGARESPKFFAVRVMGIARKDLLEVGEEFVEAGTIDQPDDLAYLKLVELETLSREEPRDWKSLIAERRATYE